MKKFRCGDIMPGCQSVFTGHENEILAAAAIHAREDHQLLDFPDDLVAQIRAAMTTV
jgi:predicted small metal-binding protein